MDISGRLLAEFCAELRLTWQQADGPSLRSLSTRALLSKSQLGAILSGRVRRLPDWDIVRSLVQGFYEYAQQRGTAANLSVRTGIDEYWRPRYAVVQHALRQSRTTTTDGPPPRVERAGASGGPRASSVARGTSLVPRQLPPAVRTFVGRADELGTLTGLLDRPGDAATTVVISGMAGIGKTVLAVAWAHRVADRFPDGQLYVNLRGFDPAGCVTDPSDALRGFLQAMDVAPSQVPTTRDGQVSLFRSLVAGKRLLVVLDNACDTEQVRPLLPGAPGSLTVVTSRNGMNGLIAVEDAHPLTLDLMSSTEASELLAARIGAPRVAAEPAAIDQIVAACGALPIALAVVAAHAATRPALTLEALAAQLRPEQARLDLLAGSEPSSDIRAIFSWSYRCLDPTAARLFRLLALYPGPQIGVAAAASLAGEPVRATLPDLTALIRANLLAEVAPGRFAMHDLLRTYATELVHATDTDGERRGALGRVLDHLLHTAYRASTVLYPGRSRLEPPSASPGTTVEPAMGLGGSLAWFTHERAALTSAIRAAAQAGFDSHAWGLAWTIADFLQRRGHWSDWLHAMETGLCAAGRAGDRHAEARLHCDLGYACSLLGRYDQAHTHLSRALQLYVELDDPVGRAATHLAFGTLLVRLDRVEDAIEEDRRALELYRTADNSVGQALTLNNTAWKYVKLGRYADALDLGQRALARHREAGNPFGEADTWDTIGYVHHHQGQHRQAIDCYRRALDLFRNRGDRYYEADTLTRLGDTLRAAGDLEAARQAWQETAAILHQLDHPEAKRRGAAARCGGSDAVAAAV